MLIAFFHQLKINERIRWSLMDVSFDMMLIICLEISQNQYPILNHQCEDHDILKKTGIDFVSLDLDKLCNWLLYVTLSCLDKLYGARTIEESLDNLSEQTIR